jgi:hypothetical protein
MHFSECVAILSFVPIAFVFALYFLDSKPRLGVIYCTVIVFHTRRSCNWFFAGVDLCYVFFIYPFLWLVLRSKREVSFNTMVFKLCLKPVSIFSSISDTFLKNTFPQV